MNVTGMVGQIVGLVVAVIVVATVMIPTIDGLHISDTTQETLISVVVIMSILAIVMASVRLLNQKF